MRSTNNSGFYLLLLACGLSVFICIPGIYLATQRGASTFRDQHGIYEAGSAEGLLWEAKGGDSAMGRTLFTANCAACHQEDGQGRVGLAPSIRNRDFLALASDGFIRATIQGGRPNTAMIPRPDLKDGDISDLVAFLRSVPMANPVKRIEIDPHLTVDGDPQAGSGLYATFCAACHGKDGEGYSAGGSGPGIGLSGFLSVASDDFILQTLKYGRMGTPMMPFIGPSGLANLSEQEAGDIIAFLRSQAGTSLAGHPADAGPPNATRGLALFETNCLACHQEGGLGKPGLAPSIRNRDFLAIASDDFIKKTVSLGRPGTAMVPRPDLSEGQVDHIIAYLRALPVPNPVLVSVDAKRRAHGDAAAGRTKFETFCASCHGHRGEGYSAGGSGPGIGLPGFLSVASDDYILQTAKYGRMGTAMMPFVGAEGLANLEEADVDDIIVYLRTLEN